MNYDVFEQLCRENGTTPTALALKLGLSKGNTSSWKQGGNPSIEKLLQIADELNCTTDVLLRTPQNFKNVCKKLNTPTLSDDEQTLLDNYRKSLETDKARIQERALTCAEHAEKIYTPKSYKVPIMSENVIKLFDSYVSAGTGIDIDYSTHTEITFDDDTENADFAVKVSGDSMMPRFQSGDVVLVESTPCIDIGEIGIFIVNNQAYIKELGKNKLISLNKKYPPIEFSENDSIYCQGRVIKILNAYREV